MLTLPISHVWLGPVDKVDYKWKAISDVLLALELAIRTINCAQPVFISMLDTHMYVVSFFLVTYR